MHCKVIEYHNGTVTMTKDDVIDDGRIVWIIRGAATVFSVLSMAVRQIRPATLEEREVAQ